MAKRFTDTGKWQKKWFRTLPTKYKCFWQYILDSCDIAGIWDVDIELASFVIGEKLDRAEILSFFKKQVVIISSDKWFLQEFVNFQNGLKLNEASPVHKKIISILEKYTLYDRVLNRVLDTQLVVVEVKEVVTVEDEVEESEYAEVLVYPTFDDFWNLYDKKVDRPKTEPKWNKLSQKEKESIMGYIPHYILSQPEKQFRKNPMTFLNNKSWENELIKTDTNGKQAGIDKAKDIIAEAIRVNT